MPSGNSAITRAALDERVVEPAILFRVDDIGAAGDDRDRAAVQRAEMGGRVDAARHPRPDDDPGFAKPGGQLARNAAPIGGGIARADNRDDRHLQQRGIAEHGQNRRRILDRRQRRGIIRLAPAHKARAEAGERRQFRLHVAQAHRHDRTRQAWQRLQ